MYSKILKLSSRIYNRLFGASRAVIPSFNFPQEIESYLIREQFQWRADKYGDYIKSPETFVRDKCGDCDDFAYFYYKLIPERYEKYMIGIWRTMFDGHAVCVYKDADGFYYYTSNKKIVGKFEKITDCVYNVYKGEKVRYDFIYGRNFKNSGTV